MKNFLFTITALLFWIGNANAQLTIEDCQTKAKANYPLIKQYDLIKQSESYNLSNANKGYLPQFSLSGKATYQSDVTKLPITLPGLTIPTLSKDQYQIVAEADQVVWDGGNIKSQKTVTKASSAVHQNFRIVTSLI